MVSSTHGFHLLDASNSPSQVLATKNVSRHCQMPLECKITSGELTQNSNIRDVTRLHKIKRLYTIKGQVNDKDKYCKISERRGSCIPSYSVCVIPAASRRNFCCLEGGCGMGKCLYEGGDVSTVRRKKRQTLG